MPSYPGGMPVPFASNRLYEPNTTIAEMILRAGQQRAQMQQQMYSGIGDTISQLGQIPAQIQQRKLLQARTQREEQLAKTQEAAMKRQEEDRAALDAAFEGGDGAAIEARLPGHLRPQFREAWDKQQEQKAKYEKAQTEAATAQSEMLATGARYLKQNHSADPDGGISAASLWVKSLPKNLQQAAGPYLQQVQQDPSTLPKILDDFISRAPSEQARLAKEANEEFTLKPGDVRFKGGKQVASGGEMPISPEQQQQNEIARARLAEDTRHHKASEGQGEAAPSLSPAGMDMAAEMFAKTGTLPPMGMGRQGATVRQAIINRAAELHPGQDIASAKAGYTADTGALSKLQAQTDAVSAFEETASKNAKLLNDILRKVPNAGASFFNKPVRAFQAALGSEDLSRFNTLRQSVANEYGRIISNPSLSGTMSDSARKEAEVLIDPNAETGAIVSALKALAEEASNRHSSYSDQLKQIKGRISGTITPGKGIKIGGYTVEVE